MSGSSDRLRTVGTVLRSQSPSAERVSIAVCASPFRLATLTRAMLRMGSFRPPPEAAPRAALPHALAVMPLDHGLELEVIGVPLDEAWAPMWALALCRANVVVRLDKSARLDEACALIGAMPVDATELAPGFSEEEEEQVANLLHAAAERAR
jgi:hypothetical protein